MFQYNSLTWYCSNKIDEIVRSLFSKLQLGEQTCSGESSNEAEGGRGGEDCPGTFSGPGQKCETLPNVVNIA